MSLIKEDMHKIILFDSKNNLIVYTLQVLLSEASKERQTCPPQRCANLLWFTINAAHFHMVSVYKLHVTMGRMYSETCLIRPPLGPKFVVLIESAYIISCTK